MTRFISAVVITLSVLLVISPSKAQALARNACGFYASPTTHRFGSAPTKYELYQTNTAQDFGIFYNRLFGDRLFVQIEARFSERFLDINFGDVSGRINEKFVEIPILVHKTGTCRIDSHPLRVYAGAGLSYGLLIGQGIDAFGTSVLPSNVNGTTEVGGYHKISWVLDAGAAFTLQRAVGIFAGYRLTVDWETFGESTDVSVTPKYIAYGFQAGFEWRFRTGGQSPDQARSPAGAEGLARRD